MSSPANGDPRCLGRLTKWSKRRPFGDGKHYFTLEYRCQKEVLSDTDTLCEICKKRPTQHKETNYMIHGKITDPIPDTSPIYGGARYVEFCKRYGEPSEEHILAAKEAHKLAIEGYPDIEMAKEGRKKIKQSKSETALTSTTTPKPHHETEPIPAHAIEITTKPIHLEVEHVSAWKKVLGDREVLVDDKGRTWKMDEKGCVVGFLGEWNSLRSDT